MEYQTRARTTVGSMRPSRLQDRGSVSRPCRIIAHSRNGGQTYRPCTRPVEYRGHQMAKHSGCYHGKRWSRRWLETRRGGRKRAEKMKGRIFGQGLHSCRSTNGRLWVQVQGKNERSGDEAYGWAGNVRRGLKFPRHQPATPEPPGGSRCHKVVAQNSVTSCRF